MMMGQNAQRVGRQTLEPYPEPQKDDGSRNQERMMEQDAKRVGGDQEKMMEQDAKRVGRQAPEL